MELQSFVSNNFNYVRIEPLSDDSKSILLRIYRQMTIAFKSLPKLRIREIESEPYDTSYIPDEIKPKLVSCAYDSSYNFRVNHRDIRLFIHGPRIDKSFNRDCIRHIFMWLSIADEYACSECSTNMTIHLYLTEHVKMMPRNGEHAIGRSHVNTAFTKPCADATTICIFRREEWRKVFIHETFHNLGLDFAKMATNSADRQIKSMFKIQADVRLFETYCETWAEIIYSQFVSFYSTRGHTNYDRMFQKLNDILRAETIFALFQCAKVLEHNNMTYIDLYSISSAKKQRNYKEDTHVLSYYIIRSILMFHKNRFIDWCVTNNPKSVMDFNKTEENVDNFCELIRGLYTSASYVGAITSIEDWYRRNKQDSSFEFNTLRMTIFG